MTKEEYIAQKKSLEDQHSKIVKAISELESGFLHEHKEFNLGEKVSVTFSGGEKFELFVRNYGLHYDGVVFYSLAKAKADGTMSSHRFDYFRHGNVELIEKIKAD